VKNTRVETIDVIFIIALLCVSPMVWLQCLSLWIRPHLQFFPFAWLAFGYIVVVRNKVITSNLSVRRLASLCVAALSFLLSVEAALISSPWLAYVAAVILVTAWMLLRLGKTKWMTVLAISSILWITVPLPVGYDGKLIEMLQSKSSLAASLVLDCLGVLHVRDGNVLDLTGKQLFVAEACSGIDSLYALMAICLSVVIWFRQPWVVGVLSLSLVPVWASCSNLLRLVTIAVGIDWFKTDLSSGTPHTILGLAVFAAAFLVDFCFIQFAGTCYKAFFDKAVPNRLNQESSVNQGNAALPNPSMRLWEMASIGILVVCFSIFGAYSFWAMQSRNFHRTPEFDPSTLDRIAEATRLPDRLGASIRQSFKQEKRDRHSTFGEHSNISIFATAEYTFTLSIDFPFRGFHPLERCYEARGWVVESLPKQINIECNTGRDQTNDGNCVVHEVDLKNAEGKSAFLLYSLFQLDGKQRKSLSSSNRGLERLEQSILEPVTFQIQLFSESAETLNQSEREERKKNFADAVTLLRNSFLFLAD